MNPEKSPLPLDANEEVSALIATLHETGQRLEELTAGEVDTVADREGRLFLLGRAQEQLRYIEAAKQAAILNALPAHIALLDSQGLIVSVNDAWRRFGCADAAQCPGYEIGVNYLQICDSAGEEAREAHEAAAGIRGVLAGTAKSFSTEYFFPGPGEPRWFLMAVTPLADGRPNGAVVMHLDITERRRTQAALAQSEDGLHRAQVMAKLAHVITGPDGSFERWSETLPRLVGVEPAQLPRATRDWLELVHPDDQPLFRKLSIAAGVDKQHKELEYRLQRADGEWINVRQTIEPLRAVATGGLRWFNTLQDVTAQRRTEESLRASEARFRQVAENIRDVFFLQNLDSSQIYYVSPAYAQIWGRSCESLYANPASWAQAIHPDDLGDASRKFTAGRETGFDYEFRILRPDGEVRWIHVRGFPVLDAAGKPYRTAGVASDVTQRKQAEIRIKRLNRVYAVLSGINALIVRVRDRGELYKEACRIAVQSGQFPLAWVAVADPGDQLVKAVAWAGDERGFAHFNRATADAKGQGKAGLAAQAIEKRIPVLCNDIEADGSAMRYPAEALERGYRSAAAFPLVVDGAAIGALVLYAAEAGAFDDEETKLLVELAGDISFALEHIEKEEKLEQSHQQLMEASRRDGMAEVATSVLHNVGNVLNSVNVSASLVAENVKSSRAGSMAKVVAMLREHEADLGSYITTDPKGRHIPAFLQQLAEDWLAQQQAVVTELDSLRTNIDHIKEIVAMQQDHARVSGSAETVNISDLVEDSLRMNGESLTRHEVRVVREFEAVPPISVQKHKVLQILVNLVRNAKQACNEVEGAKKRMTLRIALVGGRTRVSVSDNGAGIAPENLTRIFAHGFTTRKDGHGFGLHSGALAAAELGGSLSAHSDGPGKGATFTLELGQQPPAAAAP